MVFICLGLFALEGCSEDGGGLFDEAAIGCNIFGLEDVATGWNTRPFGLEVLAAGRINCRMRLDELVAGGIVCPMGLDELATG